ncbi:hypothetical protein HanPSC8_Chr17g0795601 [Helianthus annuus]|nr:hypothetical protein HanPSC8_Chr17g0795601 [Helianthus annuus]
MVLRVRSCLITGKAGCSHLDSGPAHSRWRITLFLTNPLQAVTKLE